MILCNDNTLYTGITTDITRRFAEHQAQNALCAKYLRGRSPLKLVFDEFLGEHSIALKLEYRVKRLSRKNKERLISGQLALHSLINH